MTIRALKTKILFPPFNLLKEFSAELNKNNAHLKEKDVVVITSKVVALSQNRVMGIKNDEELDDTIKQESDFYKKHGIYNHLYITIKDGHFLPNAGIDKSNVPKGKIVLYPKDIHLWTKKFLKKLKKRYGLKNLGLIVCDSRCSPLRWGVSSVACSFAGFVGLEDKRGHKDLYGKKLKFTRINKADMLANAAAILMGETTQRQPFCIVENAPIIFDDSAYSANINILNPEECLYAPIYHPKIRKLNLNENHI